MHVYLCLDMHLYVQEWKTWESSSERRKETDTNREQNNKGGH